MRGSDRGLWIVRKKGVVDWFFSEMVERSKENRAKKKRKKNRKKRDKSRVAQSRFG